MKDANDEILPAPNIGPPSFGELMLVFGAVVIILIAVILVIAATIPG